VARNLREPQNNKCLPYRIIFRYLDQFFKSHYGIPTPVTYFSWIKLSERELTRLSNG
jgi:hypothetical protein